MAEQKRRDKRAAPVKIRYAPIDEVCVYEISEAELERLERGPPGQVDLSFALALLPAALTVMITLQTVEIASNRIYYVYWIAFWLLLIQGLASVGRWWFTSGSLKNLVEQIRSRMPEQPGIAEQSPAAPPPAVESTES